MCEVTGELILKDLTPRWLPGTGSYRGKSLVMVTKGVRVVVRVVVSTERPSLGQG